MTEPAPTNYNSPPRKRSNASLAVIILLFLIVGIFVAGVRNVPGGEVGVSVNNLTREVTLADRVGLHFTIPYITSFYTLNRKTRIFDMLSNAAIPAGAVERPPDNSLSIKSSEGDTVRIDSTVTYQIVWDKAVDVLRATGYEALELMKTESTKKGSEAWRQFEHKWIWPIVRSALTERFNELKRENMNEGSERADRAELARVDANAILTKFGIEITLITVQNPTSYDEYEKIVRTRKDIDQQVAAIMEEQKQEQANQEQQKMTQSAVNEQELSGVDALHKRNITEADARKLKTIANAKALGQKEKATADKAFQIALAEADTTRKKGDAEAAGLRQLAEGLSGAKGLAVIANEIALQLKSITITASPFVYNSVVQPYLMQQGNNMIPTPMPRADVSNPTTQTPGGNIK